MQIVAKIMTTGLTPTGRGSDLKLDMLEAVNTIATIGKTYHWAQHVANMLSPTINFPCPCYYVN